MHQDCRLHEKQFGGDILRVTAILGLIRHDESQYRNSVETFVQYCEDNHLNLNVKKTKEIVLILG